MPPRMVLSALVIEELLDLLSHSGHDCRVEERIETCEQECADDDCDEDLDAGVDVAFSSYGKEPSHRRRTLRYNGSSRAENGQ